MKFNKLYLTLAAGALSVVPVFAADAKTSATPAKAEAPKTEAKKAEAPKVDPWSLIPEVVATVDGKPVTKAELIANAGQLPPGITPEDVARQAPRVVQKMLVDRFVKADFEAHKPKVTKEEARKILMDELNAMSPQERQTLQQILKQQGKTIEQALEEMSSNPETLDGIARNKFFKAVIFKDCDTTDEEAKKYYDAHLGELPEVIEASHILVLVKPNADEAAKKAALDKINRIAEELKKDPAKFAEIARKDSDCPSKAQGGKLGEFQRGQMVPEFEAAAFALKKGEISGVVKTKFGYHIIRCDAPLQRKTFEMAKEEIKQMLSELKAQKAIKNYIDGLMKRNKAVILIKEPAPAPAPAPAAK